MSGEGKWEVWETCEALVWAMLERAETQRKWPVKGEKGLKDRQREGFSQSEAFGTSNENCFCGPVQCRKPCMDPFKPLSNANSIPVTQADLPEKQPFRRPTSSQSNRSSTHSSLTFLSPSEFNRPAFELFLHEFLLWCSQTAYISPGIRVRAESLGKGLEDGKLVDVRSGIKLMRDLEGVCAGFPASLAGLYEEAQVHLPPSSALLQAKSALQHSQSSLSLQHLLSLRQVSHPSPEVEVTCLAFLLLLGVLDGIHVLNLHKNAWKAYQIYLRQPGKCLQAIKRTSSAVETGEISDELITKLEEKVGRIEEMALKGVAGGSACVGIRRYLKDVIGYHTAVWRETAISQ